MTFGGSDCEPVRSASGRAFVAACASALIRRRGHAAECSLASGSRRSAARRLGQTCHGDCVPRFGGRPGAPSVCTRGGSRRAAVGYGHPSQPDPHCAPATRHGPNARRTGPDDRNLLVQCASNKAQWSRGISASRTGLGDARRPASRVPRTAELAVAPEPAQRSDRASASLIARAR